MEPLKGTFPTSKQIMCNKCYHVGRKYKAECGVLQWKC